MKYLKTFVSFFVLAAFLLAPIQGLFASDVLNDDMPPVSSEMEAETADEDEPSNLEGLPQIAITDFLVNGQTFSSGDTITGKITIRNASAFPVSGLKYNVRLTDYNINEIPNLSISPQIREINEIISPDESVEIDFSYVVPDAIPPILLALTVSIQNDKNLTLNWRQSNLMSIDGKVESMVIMGASVVTEDGIFSPGEGPSIYSSNGAPSAQLSFKLLNNSLYPRSATPKISFHEIKDPSKIIYEMTGDVISVPSESERDVTISLPNFDYTPGVYVGSMELYDENISVAGNTSFRYIVAGKIVNIHNIVSDKQSVEKGDTVNLTIDYTGAPFDITDVVRSTSADQNAHINVTLFNEKDREVGVYEADHDFVGGKLSIAVEADKNANALKAIAVVSDGDSILSVKEVFLTPDYETIVNKHSTKTIYIVLAVVLLIIVGIIIFVLKRENGSDDGLKNNKARSVGIASVAALLMIASGFISTSTNSVADALESGSIDWPGVWSGTTYVSGINGCIDASTAVSLSVSDPVHKSSISVGDSLPVKGISWYKACRNNVTNSSTSVVVHKYNGIPTSAQTKDNKKAGWQKPNEQNDNPNYTRTYSQDIANHSTPWTGGKTWYDPFADTDLGGFSFSGTVPSSALATPGYYTVSVFNTSIPGACTYQAWTRVWIEVKPPKINNFTVTNTCIESSNTCECAGSFKIIIPNASNAYHYNIYRAASENGNYELLDTLEAGPGGGDLVYADSPGGDSEYYYYKVSTVDPTTGLESEKSASQRTPNAPRVCDLSFNCKIIDNKTTAKINEIVSYVARYENSNSSSEDVIYEWFDGAQNLKEGKQLDYQFTTIGEKNIKVVATQGNISVETICPVTVISADPIEVSCLPPVVQEAGKSSTWKAVAKGGATGIYNFLWSGSEGSYSIYNTNTYSNPNHAYMTYPTAGTKTATVQVSSNGQTTSAICTMDVPAAPIPDPVCGSANGVATANAPTTGLCSVGSSTGMIPGETTFGWGCKYQTKTVACSAPRTSPPPEPESPLCGSATESAASETAPTSNLCAFGSASNRYTDNSGHHWECILEKSDEVVTCSAPKKCASGEILVDGVCVPPGPSLTLACGSAAGPVAYAKPTNNLCAAGTPSTVTTIIQGGQPFWTWRCENGIAAPPQCFAPKDNEPKCGMGAYSPLIVDYPPASNMLCGTNTAGNTAVASPIQTLSDRYQWTCSIGTNLRTCSVDRPDTSSQNPVCGPAGESIYHGGYASRTQPSDIDACSVGARVMLPTSSTHFNWKCVNDSKQVLCSQVREVGATCGPANGQTFTQNPPNEQLCTVGDHHGSTLNTATNKYSWQCEYNQMGGEYSSVTCSANHSDSGKPPACGTAFEKYSYIPPTSYLCANGDTLGSYYNLINGRFEWNCGTNTTEPVLCYSYRHEYDAACGSAANGVPRSTIPTGSSLCSKGSSTGAIRDILTNTWIWTCTGINSSAFCSVPGINVVGGAVCGINGKYVDAKPTSGLCKVGTASVVNEIVSGNDTVWKWDCVDPDQTVSCAVYKTNGDTEDPVCGPAHKVQTSSQPTSGLCNFGTSQGVTYDSNRNIYEWTCGIGSERTSCFAPRSNSGDDDDDDADDDDADDDGDDDGDDPEIDVVLSFDPPFVPTPTSRCSAVWQTSTSDGSVADCYITGGQYNNENVPPNSSGFSVLPGSYTITCYTSDGSSSDSDTQMCRVLPNFEER